MVQVCNVMMLKMTLLLLFFILITHFTHFIAAFSKANILFKSLIEVECISQFLIIHNERTEFVKLHPRVAPDLLLAVLHHHM